MTVAHQVSRPAEARDYVLLLKPRVMSLVVFTAGVGALAAPGQASPLTLVAILAIALGAGAAGALNMWYDADIDAQMARTRLRPVPLGRVAGAEALALGLIVSALSVVLMALAANYLAAGLLAFTIFFYAVIYTMGLKRRTPQNIVIGGAAGALPPVVGWAAAADLVPGNAWLLFLIIFLWTPPHFWALALYQSGDYAKAGVPMLPVTHGAKVTRGQILLYSFILVPVTLAPVVTGLGGWIYLAVAGVGGLAFIGLALRVFFSKAGDDLSVGGAIYPNRQDIAPARTLFAFSIFFLTAVFAALLAEHGFGLYFSVDAAQQLLSPELRAAFMKGA